MSTLAFKILISPFFVIIRVKGLKIHFIKLKDQNEVLCKVKRLNVYYR